MAARRFYLAYGSNLNLSRMAAQCPGAAILGTAALTGWRLAFCGCGGGNYLTIEPDPQGAVPVAVWAITPEDEKALDQYEDYPALYFKRELPVTYREQGSNLCHAVQALVYIMVDGCRPGLPTASYMEECRAGYRSFGFDTALLQQAYEAASLD